MDNTDIPASMDNIAMMGSTGLETLQNLSGIMDNTAAKGQGTYRFQTVTLSILVVAILS